MGQGGQQWLSARRRADWRSAAAQRESRSSGGVIISPWTSGGVAVDIESANNHRSAACGTSPVDGEDATYARSPPSPAGFVYYRSEHIRPSRVRWRPPVRQNAHGRLGLSHRKRRVSGSGVGGMFI